MGAPLGGWGVAAGGAQAAGWAGEPTVLCVEFPQLLVLGKLPGVAADGGV